jgi:hypothetical protein
MTQSKCNRVLFLAIDCEYANAQTHMVNNHNYITYDVIDTGVYTEIDGQQYYKLFTNTNFISAVRKVLESFPDFKTYVFYAFYSTAELSTSSVSDIYNAGFTITRLYRSMRGYNLELRDNNSKKIVKIIDARILTSVENLESLVTLFAPDVENPKEYRRRVLGDDEVESDFYLKMTEEQRYHYNYLDCRGLYIAVKNFKLKMTELIKQIFGIDISKHVDKIETLGGFAKLVIKQLDKHGLLKSYSDVVKEKDKNIDVNTKEIFKIGWNLYRGGGLIINYAPLLQKSKTFKNVNLYDVKSLYPLSGYLAAHFLAGFEHSKFIHKFGSDAIKFIQNCDIKKFGGYVYVGLKFNGGINGKPYVGYRKLAKEIVNLDDDIENYRICYTRIIPPQWYTIQEAKFILSNGYVVDDSLDVNHIKLFAWEVNEKLISENPLYVYFGRLLEYRLKLKDEVMSKLVKMLLNIAYGKIAQHKQQSKNSVIVNPIVAGYLTSISRLIMFHFVDTAIHMATDSVFTHQQLDENEYRRKIEQTLKIKFPEFYTTFLSAEGHGDVFIYKCKAYMFVKSDGTVKLAHHGLRLRGKQNIIKFFQTVQSLKPSEPVVFVIKRFDWYSFDIIKHWINLKSEKIVMNPNIVQQIQELQQLIFRPMLLEQIHILSSDFTFQLKDFSWNSHTVNNPFLFETVTDYENNLLGTERQKLRIRNQIKNGNLQIKSTTKLSEVFKMYKNKIKVIEIDCR